MIYLKCGPTQIQGRACRQELVTMDPGECISIHIKLPRFDIFSTIRGQYPMRSEYIATGRIIGVIADILSLMECYFRFGQLLLAGQGNRLNRQPEDASFVVIGRMRVKSQKKHGIFILAANEHGLCFQQLKSRCPIRIEILELSISPTSFALAIN
ncbi:MAG: hypothetical protein ABR991_00940 [Terracidiphilus sp.]